jgi:transcriptional regulator GlxA family with amidase domain
MSSPASKIRFGAVLFEGFELLDVYGPLEMFGLLDDKAEIVVFGPAPGPVRSSKGPAGMADLALDAPDAVDVLLIPGGIGTRRAVEDASIIAALRAKAEQAAHVATVCTGTSLLARTGLLDGRRATTNKLAFSWVQSQGPGVTWVREARWVEDGRYFTSSGVSAGMDMALALIVKLFDRETSLRIALRAEYDWHQDSTWDPFARKAGLVG